jgi:hypothetical protein
MAAGVLAAAPCAAAAPAAAGPCSLRAAAEGACGEAARSGLQDPAATPPQSPPQTPKRRDSLKNGAIIGGAIGLALGLVAAGISDCPGDDPDGSCPAARVGGVAVSTAFWAGIGIGLDALVTDRTNAAVPPASRTRNRLRTLPPRPALAMRVRW